MSNLEMSNLELFVFAFFAANAVITITLTMILDSRIQKLERRMRNKYVR